MHNTHLYITLGVGEGSTRVLIFRATMLVIACNKFVTVCMTQDYTPAIIMVYNCIWQIIAHLPRIYKLATSRKSMPTRTAEIAPDRLSLPCSMLLCSSLSRHFLSRCLLHEDTFFPWIRTFAKRCEIWMRISGGLRPGKRGDFIHIRIYRNACMKIESMVIDSIETEIIME